MIDAKNLKRESSRRRCGDFFVFDDEDPKRIKNKRKKTRKAESEKFCLSSESEKLLLLWR